MITKQTARKGFTIVELLIVIVVIGILAAITIVSFNGVTTKANNTKIASDLNQFKKAIIVARDAKSLTFIGITSGITYSGYSYSSCASKPAGTDFATLDKTNDPCWTRYAEILKRITDASGINVTNLVDPWGRPYFIDENEGESGGCGSDMIAAFSNPYTGGNSTIATSQTSIPISGYSGCR
jgi:prepilin-type N-terminal cleavage/methylation domain-containing protein